jgi:hypothetical protein
MGLAANKDVPTKWAGEMIQLERLLQNVENNE